MRAPKLVRRLAAALAPLLVAACGGAPIARGGGAGVSPAGIAAPEVPLPPAAAVELAPAEEAPDPALASEAVLLPAVSAEPPAAPTTPARVFAEPVVPRERTRAVVLLYHLFGAMDSPFAIAPEAFDDQLQWLADHHVTVVSTSELLRFLDGELALPERVAVITIDDGHKSIYRRAFPILARRSMPFTLALNTGAIEGRRREAMTWEEVRTILASGLCEIESHSHIHGHMDRLTVDRNRREAELSRSILEARIGVRPEAFVFPFGGYDAKVRRVVEEAGYRAAFAASGREVTAASPRFALPRIGVGRETTMAAFAGFFAEPRRRRQAAAGERQGT